MKDFRGTYTVLVTPFTEDGSAVDLAALARLVEFQIAEGIHGLIRSAPPVNSSRSRRTSAVPSSRRW